MPKYCKTNAITSLFSIPIVKRIVDTLQEEQFLPGNCPISHPEEAQENIILKESLLFFFFTITTNTAAEGNCLD